MKKIISLGFALASISVTAFSADQHIAFERKDAVYVANLSIAASSTSVKTGMVRSRRSKNSISPAKKQFALRARMISFGSRFG
jgi:hypothetical protein